MTEPVLAIPGLVKQLYGVVAELESLFPGRRFTPDGHLVGSIGEVIAKYRYGLTLLPSSTPVHDAKATDGRLVQIKATQGKSIALREKPDHLIVLFLDSDGKDKEIFNGPGLVAWAACGQMQRNGQRSISISKLKTLMESVQTEARLKKIYR